MKQAAYFITDPWSGDTHPMADTVFEGEKPTHAKLLGPDGEPLQYQRQRLGFDLSPKRKATP